MLADAGRSELGELERFVNPCPCWNAVVFYCRFFTANEVFLIDKVLIYPF